jgi:pilus biogenesis lipoprotein CpaD
MIPRPLPLCLALALALAGCATPPPRAAREDGTSTAKTLRVDHVRMQHAVQFAPGSPDPAPGELERLTLFLGQAELRSGDHLYLEPASGDRLAAPRIGRLVKALDRRGIGARALPAAVELEPNRMRVVIDHYVAVLPDCPDWTASPDVEHDNLPASNFGCANVTNFGLMLADPHDLLVGRQPGPADADPALLAIARYRAGHPKSLTSDGPQTPTLNLVTTAAGGGGQPGQ